MKNNNNYEEDNSLFVNPNGFQNDYDNRYNQLNPVEAEAQRAAEKAANKVRTKAAKKANKNYRPVAMIWRILGKILFIIQLLLEVITGFLMHKSNMIPLKYEIVAYVLMILLLILTFCLLRHGFPRKKFTVGMVLTLVISIFFGCIFYYVYGGLSTLEDITGIRYETVVYGVYVRTEDPAQTIEDAGNYSFGVISDLDRDDTDKVISDIEDDVGHSISTVNYSDMMTEVNALLNSETGAMIMNEANVGVIETMDGYDNIEDRIREIGTYSISRLIYTAPDENAEINAEETFAVYISGIDVYGDTNTVSRSDVNIIAVVNPTTHQVLLVSTPRDFYVPLSISNGVKDKLTHAGLYGIDCSVETLEMLYDMDIDYSLRVNFTGFKNIIDALGGVTVHSDYAFTTGIGGYSIVQGDNYLNGDQALGFARERHAFAEGDRQRGSNQMEVIKAVIKKMTSPAILMNYTEVMSGLSGSVNSTIPDELVSALVSDQLDSGEEWDVQSYSVNGTNSSGTTYSIPSQSLYVMEPDMNTVNQAIAYIDAVENNEIITVAQ